MSAVVAVLGMNTQRRTCITSVLPSGQVHVRSAIVIGPLWPCVNQNVSEIVPDAQITLAVIPSLAVNVPGDVHGSLAVTLQGGPTKVMAVESVTGVPNGAAVALTAM
jgi:hypothetical protein